MGEHGSVLRASLDNAANRLENQRGLILTSMTKPDGCSCECFASTDSEECLFHLSEYSNTIFKAALN